VILLVQGIHSLHLRGSINIDSLVNQILRIIPFFSTMIVKVLTHQHYALVQTLASDQFVMEKCHVRLLAICVISHPGDPDQFIKLISGLVRFVVSLDFCFLIVFFL